MYFSIECIERQQASQLMRAKEEIPLGLYLPPPFVHPHVTLRIL